MEIRKGDKFVCLNRVIMKDGKIAYIEGKEYTSPCNGCITGEQGRDHIWTLGEADKHFARFTEEDYFQSMQEECSRPVGHALEGCAPEKFDSTVKIMETFSNLSNLLVYKNTLYGDSGIHPIKIFSKATSETGLLQRLDDKIARVQNSPDIRKNDVADIIGYLVLICVSKGWTNFDEFKD